MTVPTSAGSNPPEGASQTDPAPSNPQAGATAPSADGQHPQAGEGQIDPGKIREIQRENQALRKRLAEIDEAARQAELAKLGETEKAKAEAAKHQQSLLELQQKHQALLVRSAIRDSAIAEKFRHPEDAYLHIMNSGELEFDEDGNPKNVDALVKKLANARADLLDTQTPAPQPAPQPGLTPANPSRSSQNALPPFDPKNPPRLTDRAVWDSSKR